MGNIKLWLVQNKKRICPTAAVLLAVAVLGYCYGLVYFSEYAAQVSADKFTSFLKSELSGVLLWSLTLVAVLAVGAIALLTRKLSVAIGTVSLLIFVPHAINGVKMIFRDEPFYPWDVGLAGEVGNIMSALDPGAFSRLIWPTVYVLLGLTAAILLDIFIMKYFRFGYNKEALVGGVLLIALVGSCCMLFSKSHISSLGVKTTFWNQADAYQKYGFAHAFILNWHKAGITVPQGYSEQAVTETVTAIRGDGDEGTRPNIIVVMSEAFTDIEGAQNLTFSREVTPNFHALSEEYLSGRVMTSVYGGGTANSEFEVLTGYSTYSLPSGTIAYMAYVNRQLDSYVSFLRGEGYTTLAMHPYTRNFFARDKAYELMGFDTYLSLEHFEGAQRVRAMNYVSDMAVTERIIAEYEANLQSGKPFFCHAVTMQNHTSYVADEFEEEITLTRRVGLNDEEAQAMETYATGLYLSDQALGALVEYFEAVEEPTVIVFFGDHQPSITTDKDMWTRMGYIDDMDSAEGVFKFRTTPYLIWNNFEAQPTSGEENMSMYQLLPYMTDKLGVVRPLFHDYLDEMRSHIKGMTRQIVLSGEDELSFEMDARQREIYDEYWRLVYDNLLGSGYSGKMLFARSN